MHPLLHSVRKRCGFPYRDTHWWLGLGGFRQSPEFIGSGLRSSCRSGLGTDRETQSLLRETLSLYAGPVLLDADALQSELLTDIPSPERLVLTPHAGEYQRISQGVDPQTFAEKNPSVLVLKGTHTRVLQADQSFHCLGGSTILARGGSGDLLAGIIGSLLASGNHSSSKVPSWALLGTVGQLKYWPVKMANFPFTLPIFWIIYLLPLEMTSEPTPTPTLLVLAAGLGSRYGGLKQLEQLGPSGETLMDYSIYDAQQSRLFACGFSNSGRNAGTIRRTSGE